MIKIKKGLDHKELEKLGYTFVPVEGGYISQDLATIITTDRLGHKREVMQYRENAETEHVSNVEKLSRIGAIEDK